MFLTIAITVLVLYIGWIVYEIVKAPTVKSESDKWHDECVEARKKSS